MYYGWGMRDDVVVEQFIEQMGLALEEDRLPRIAGRIMGLLLIEGGPLAFEDIARFLRVSRGSVSTNTRLLQNLGVVDRTTRPGDRRDFYQIAQTPGRELLAVSARQLRQRCRMIASAREALAPSRTEARQRLAELERFYGAVSRGLDATLRELSHPDDGEAEE